jgi:hypothetical protein
MNSIATIFMTSEQVYDGIIRPVVRALALKWFISYIYYLKQDKSLETSGQGSPTLGLSIHSTKQWLT